MSTKFAAAFGTFDGIHVGHKKILDAVLAVKELRPLVVTFDRPPKSSNGLLMTPAQKLGALKDMGFRDQLVLRFEEVRDLSPEAFVDFIFSKYDIGFLACGCNFRFGKDACGDPFTLASLAAARGAVTMIMHGIFEDGEMISSTRVRSLIADGNMEEAEALSGRPFSLTAPVVHGDERGRAIGFPTINQIWPEELVQPRFGVYAARAVIDGEELPAIANVGFRPTFQSEKLLAETHVFGLSDELYGREVTVKFLRFLRPERKFGSQGDLASAIAADVAAAKEFL